MGPGLELSTERSRRSAERDVARQEMQPRRFHQNIVGMTRQEPQSEFSVLQFAIYNLNCYGLSPQNRAFCLLLR
jgi:hypothetical protein